MLSSILADEEPLTVSVCYFNDRMDPFISGQNSLDMTKYAKLVTLKDPLGRLDLLSPSRAF